MTAFPTHFGLEEELAHPVSIASFVTGAERLRISAPAQGELMVVDSERAGEALAGSLDVPPEFPHAKARIRCFRLTRSRGWGTV